MEHGVIFFLFVLTLGLTSQKWFVGFFYWVIFWRGGVMPKKMTII